MSSDLSLGFSLQGQAAPTYRDVSAAVDDWGYTLSFGIVAPYMTIGDFGFGPECSIGESRFSWHRPFEPNVSSHDEFLSYMRAYDEYQDSGAPHNAYVRLRLGFMGDYLAELTSNTRIGVRASAGYESDMFKGILGNGLYASAMFQAEIVSRIATLSMSFGPSVSYFPETGSLLVDPLALSLGVSRVF